MENSSNKTIAKNTLFLYVRMLMVMAVSLFTSRVILQTLGVEDYGIFNSVIGVLGAISFLNYALATGTARFVTYSLGKNDEHETQVVFSTALTIHIVLSILIVILAETVGLWFLHHKLVIPLDRMSAAAYCYHLNVLSAAIGITQAPYNALLIGHEKMKTYAYIGIVEVLLKLLIVYALYISSLDKLKMYATLFFLLTVGIMVFYRWYCIRHFKEAHYNFSYNKSYVRQISAFSGWSILNSGASALNNEGKVVLLNMFFSPAVVAARAISIQVDHAVLRFVSNFRTAVNPQITKQWAAGNNYRSQQLVIESAKFSFYLVLIFAVPILCTTEALLRLWLGQVPEYSVQFVQLSLINMPFGVLNYSLYQALNAHGNIKSDSIITLFMQIAGFILSYLFLRLGCSPLVVSYFTILVAFVMALVEKPIMLVKIVGYRWRDFMSLTLQCFLVTTGALVIPFVFYLFIYKDRIYEPVAVVYMIVISGLSTLVSVWYIGLSKNMRIRLINYAKSRLNIKRKLKI